MDKQLPSDTNLEKVIHNHGHQAILKFVHDPKSKLPKANDQFIIFNKNLDFLQGMYFIYKQIEKKGLYFYVLQSKQFKILKPDLNIGKVYDKYKDQNKVLYVMYSDRNFAQSKVLNCMFYFAQIVLVLYGLLYAYFYFYGGSNETPSNQNDIKLDLKPQGDL